MREYHKIDTVFERDMAGTKKLLNGVYRDETVKFLASCEWEFTEKIDGTNIRVCWDGHRVSFLGRTDKAQIPPHLAAKLETLFGGQENEQIFEQLFQDNEVCLFGEGYGVKIQNGGLYRPDVSFILFDVLVGETMLRRPDVEAIAKAFSVDVVPVVLRGTIASAVEFVKSCPDSTIGTAKMEGVVGRPAVEILDRGGHRVIVKIKCCDFAEGA